MRHFCYCDKVQNEVRKHEVGNDACRVTKIINIG